MFKDKFGQTLNLGDFIIYTRTGRDSNIYLGEIVKIKKDWGYLCDTEYWYNSHNKINLNGSSVRIIKTTDPILIKALKVTSSYIEGQANVYKLYNQ